MSRAAPGSVMALEKLLPLKGHFLWAYYGVSSWVQSVSYDWGGSQAHGTKGLLHSMSVGCRK